MCVSRGLAFTIWVLAGLSDTRETEMVPGGPSPKRMAVSRWLSGSDREADFLKSAFGCHLTLWSGVMFEIAPPLTSRKTAAIYVRIVTAFGLHGKAFVARNVCGSV